jgi:hypothetical protein
VEGGSREPSETYGDPDQMENLGERTRPGPGSDTTRLNRGDKLSDTEMAQDDDLEREGERVLDEASDLEEDKDETSLDPHPNTHNSEDVSPGTSTLDRNFHFVNMKECKDKAKKTVASAKKLPHPPTAQLEEKTVSAGKKKSCFPPQYFTIRATKQRCSAPTVLGGVGSQGRSSQSAVHCSQDSGFDVCDDKRQYAAKNFHRMDVSRNISTSISADLECLACIDPHSVGGDILGGIPRVFVVSDQAFPPILPTEDGNCITIVRVEDGTLNELATVFCDLFAKFLVPAVGLPPGSVILIGSLSHLGRRGLANYAEELVRTIGTLTPRVGAAVEIVPLVFVPLGGISSPGTVRDAFDLDSWILGSGRGEAAVLGGARGCLWDTIRGQGGGGGVANSDERSLFLPHSYRNPRRRNFLSPDADPSLPSLVKPFSKENEEKLVKTLIAELTGNYGLRINKNPSFERGGSSTAADTVPGRIILIGASHMMRLAEHMPPGTVNLAIPGFKATAASVMHLAQKLKMLSPGPEDTIFLDLLSNTAFKGTDEDGLPSPSFSDGDGKYHIPGSLTTAPSAAVKKLLANSNEIAKLAAEVHSVTIFAPIPRYVTEKCCPENCHVDNFNSEDFDSDILAGMETHKKILESWAIENGINYRIFDATELEHPAETILRNRTTSSGIPLWAPGDPVHLAPEAYREMAEVLLEGDSDMVSEAGSASTAESTASGQKRKRPASVITKPIASKAKMGRGDYGHRVAEWLVGRPEPARGASSRPYRPWRGGRAWGRHGWRGGRRGWGGRRGGY